jgi:hypothetical protein
VPDWCRVEVKRGRVQVRRRPTVSALSGPVSIRRVDFVCCWPGKMHIYVMNLDGSSSMEGDGERQVQAREPSRQALGRVRGAVIQDKVQAANPAAPGTAEEHLEEVLELDEALALEAAGQGFARGDQQAGEQLTAP